MQILIKLLGSIKASYLPAFITLAVVFFCTVNTTSNPLQLSVSNIWFYIICLCNLIFLFFSKNSKTLFFTLFIVVLYICISKIASSSNIPLMFHPLYQWICLLLPINLFLIKNIPDTVDLSLTDTGRKKLSKKYSLRNFYILCAFLLQATIVENFYISGFNNLPESFSLIGFMFSVVFLIYLLIFISIYPSVKNNCKE